jgi:ABC-2 type transport system permease protein
MPAVTATAVAVTAGIVLEGGLVTIYVLKPTLLDGSVKNVFGWLSVMSRYYNFSLAIFDVSGIVYYLSITILFAFLTVQVIKKKRWS